VRNPFRHSDDPPARQARPNELRGGIAAPNRLATDESNEADGRDDPTQLDSESVSIPGLDDEIAAEVAGLMERLETLSPDEGRRLVSFWKTVDEAARSSAHEAARGAARESGLVDVVKRLQRAAAMEVGWRFMSHGPVAALNAELGTPDSRAVSLGPLQPLSEAVSWPVVDAVAAVVLSDWLSDRAYDALYQPWERAIDEFTPPDDESDGDGQDDDSYEEEDRQQGERADAASEFESA